MTTRRRDRESKAAALRHRMVDSLQRGGSCTAPAVEAAMREVPRHRFLPEIDLATAYADRPQPTLSRGGVSLSTVSQPTMVAQMLDHGRFGAGQSVLEIGTGRGYNAALLGHIVGPSGSVVTVDIEAELVELAQQTLQTIDLAWVRAVVADGRRGWPASAPFDRIIATAAVEAVPPAWSEELAESGVLIVPLEGPRECVVWAKSDGELVEQVRLPARFVPLR